MFFNNISVSLFIGEPQIKVNPSWRFVDLREGLVQKALKLKIAAKNLKEHQNNFLSRSSSHSGLDASIQAKKQA
jgi:hypothetical protein